MYSDGCVFVDHTRSLIRTKHKVDINVTETVKARLTFEREYQIQEVATKGYHNDNVVFDVS